MKRVSYIEEPGAWREEFRFSTPIKIRFSETDMFGHMNNVSAFTYFEEARIEFLKSLDMFEASDHENAAPIVADLQCDYLQQIYFDDRLHVFVKAHHVGTTSLDLHYMAINESENVVLTGRGRLVYFNPQTGKPIALSEDLKQTLLNA